MLENQSGSRSDCECTCSYVLAEEPGEVIVAGAFVDAEVVAADVAPNRAVT